MLKILIVDDSEIIRNLLLEYFEEKGYYADYAEDGLEGLEKALNGDFHIIFCDIHMPKRNGYVVLKEVLAQKPYTRFVMTDSLPDELADLAQEEGAHCILTKPFDLDEVDAIIDEITVRTKVSK